MSGNELKYTSLTNDDILKQVQDRFLKTHDYETNHKFDNFRESSMAQTLIEIFAGTVDINNYYIQRRAEECYFDTAQLKSSVISLSRMFGYVMNRKSPSHAKLRMIIEGDIKDNQVQIPYYSKFSFDGNPYVLVNTMTYRMSTDSYNKMSDDSKIIIDNDSFENPIEIVQGSIKEKVFNGATNSQVNAPFQIYKIEDTSFSNVYGDKDFFYNDVTQIYVGDVKNEETRFNIDRRSLLNWETINTSNLSHAQSVCVVRTATDGTIELLFGDGNPENTNTNTNQQASGGFARKGAITRKDNIYVQYLSCEGRSTNKTGVIGDKVEFSGKIFNSNGDDITSKISFEMLSNSYGGADDESMDSIKYSSPKIYYSLDRLVSKDDYVAYMKSINTPINVQNAVAWGEQEERDLAFKFALAKMFNVVLFTMTGSMYDLDANPHIPKIGAQYEDVVLDLNYDPYQFQTQGYFNIFVIQEMVNQLKRYAVATTFYELAGSNFANTNASKVGSGVTDSAKQLDAIASSIKSQIKSAYPGGVATLKFKYTSDSHENSSNIIADGGAKVEGLNATTLTDLTGKTYLENLAGIIDTALRDVKDVRGNRTDNKNFDKQAFFGRWDIEATPNAIIIWDTLDIDNNTTGQEINGAVYEFRTRWNEYSEISKETPSPCYITKFIEDSTFAKILGLDNHYVTTVTETEDNNEMNGKITQVVNDLSGRSQVNVKNIYVSPIIHRFNIVGDVYVKSLYDKEDVRREITNKLYEWLDINADFNEPLYISNIVEIFESHLGVIHANIRLEPQDITAGKNNDSNVFYDATWDNPIYSKYTVDIRETYTNTDGSSGGNWRLENKIADTINNALSVYLSPSDETSTANDEWYRKFIATSYGRGGGWFTNTDGVTKGGSGTSKTTREQTLESYSYTLLNDVSERTFYTKFAGPLYTFFKNEANSQNCPGSKPTCGCECEPNYGLFIGLPENITNDYRSDVVRDTIVKTDFAIIMEQIHKDLSYIIMENLLDSSGNIDTEYNSNSTYVRGGYTLGSEIVQVLTESTYQDDKDNSIPFLKFRYK